jgi:hypothetical protein
MTATEWFLSEFKKQVWFEKDSELDIWINELIPKAIELDKQNLLIFGCIVAMKAHSGQSGWSIEQLYNEMFEK